MRGVILVTGGSGFIGSHLCRYLFGQYDVVLIDTVLPEHKYFSDFKNVDVRSRDDLKNIFNSQRFNAVVHLAAQTSSIISQEDPRLDYETNILGTQNVASLCREFSVPIVFTSSMAIYNVEKIDISTIPEPASNYGVSKYLAETFVRDLARSNMNYSILRLFNVYGIGQDLSNLKQGMMSIFIAMAIKDRSIVVKGSKDRTRDFIHVSDVCREIASELEALLDRTVPYHSVKNICSGNSISVEKLTKKIANQFDYPIDVSFEGGFKEDIMKVECSDCICGNTVDFDDGIKEFVDWAIAELEVNI